MAKLLLSCRSVCHVHHLHHYVHLSVSDAGTVAGWQQPHRRADLATLPSVGAGP